MKTNARIYVMKNESGQLKLGHSVDPERRSKQLGSLDIVHQTDVLEQVEKIERLAHRVLALHGQHIRGEWFEASLDDALMAIEIATRQAEQSELPLGGKLNRERQRRQLRAVTVPLRLPDGMIADIDAVIADRGGESSRNSVLREAIRKGLAAMKAG